MDYLAVIADDEKRILNGIKTSIPWEALGIELIGTAENGLDLLKLIEQKQPDIVLIDIKMPYLSGIDVIRECSRKGYAIEFIILSGYNDFNYAKLAMNFGVREYLLKPAGKVEIIEVLERCISRLNVSRKKRQFDTLLEDNMKLVKPFLREQIIRDALLGLTFSRDVPEQYDIINEFENERYRLVLLMQDYNSLLENQANLVKLSEIYLSELKISVVTILNQFVVILILADEIDKINAAFLNFKNEYYNIYQRKMIVTISENIDISELHRTYIYLQKLMKTSFLHLTDKILFADEYKEKMIKSDSPINFDEYDDVLMYIKQNDYEAIGKIVNECFNEMQVHSFNNDMIRNFLIGWAFHIFFNFNDSPNEQIAEIINSIQSTVSFDEMETKMNHFCLELAAKRRLVTLTRVEELVNKIKNIIADEYQNPELTVKYIGEKILFTTPEYIGKIFKRITQESINNYINRYRIEKATKLLKSQNLKIFEIAEMCGFGNNSQYFSQVFKKITGVSPTDYQAE